jgi:hypothetical protein
MAYLLHLNVISSLSHWRFSMGFLDGSLLAIRNPLLHGPAKHFTKSTFRFFRILARSFHHLLKVIYFYDVGRKKRNLRYHAVLRKKGLESSIALTGGEYDIQNPVLSNTTTA